MKYKIQIVKYVEAIVYTFSIYMEEWNFKIL